MDDGGILVIESFDVRAYVQMTDWKCQWGEPAGDQLLPMTKRLHHNTSNA